MSPNHWTLGLPYALISLRFDPTFGVLYKEPLKYIEEEELKSNETIVHCCHILHILEFVSLCPFGALFFLPNISFSCELVIERWRIEVVEAQVENSVSLVHRGADRGSHSCNL